MMMSTDKSTNSNSFSLEKELSEFKTGKFKFLCVQEIYTYIKSQLIVKN